jgi:predicted nucleic acid-binding protein
MNGNNILLDTNTILYFLSGDQTVADFIKEKRLFISIISELELLSYKKITSKDLKTIAAFIKEIHVENISQEIKEEAIKIRRKTNLKLPDCIIASTSIILEIPIFSADKELRNVKNLDLIFYEK